MQINVPELSLILMIGVSGSGKSTFAQKHFKKHEIVSSDECRGMVSNDENSLEATNDAFDVLNYIIAKRLKRGLLTVIDATNVKPESRKKLIQLAREYHTLPTAIVLDMPEKLCQERNQARPDRNMGRHVIRNQKQDLKRSIRRLKREGFRKVHVLTSPEEVASVTEIVREKLYNDKKEISGPFDIIGDIHGCYQETTELLEKLGYQIKEVENNGQNFGLSITHPEGRKVIFLGDLVDRGPASPAVLKLVMSMVHQETAFCVPGNHDLKLQKKLKGKNVSIQHGLAETLEQLEQETPEFIEQVQEFLYSLISHYVFDHGKLVVAHAGIPEAMQGRGSAAVRAFCLYGETTGEIDEFGLPVRYNWASEYRGNAKVIYGHTPIPEPEWLNKTLNIDTGCVFGGKLTALRYPEEELVSVPAHKVYCEPVRPLEKPATTLSQQQEYDDVLDISEVIGKRFVQTRLRNNITIQEENSIAALEVMSRFAVNPKWLMYLPPTMSPSETSALPEFLEHPKEALEYYKKQGIKKVVCEEKHMGSRAVLVICQNEAVANKRFGIENEGFGICYTRTGRNFFNDKDLEQAFLTKVLEGLNKANFWEKFQTDWVCLDAELMPWSAKAQALLKEQYAAVGSASKHSLQAVEEVLLQTAQRNLPEIEDLLSKIQDKKEKQAKYVKSYQNYCWEVETVEDFKLAPFHILATEGKVHTNQNHEWHMKQIHDICEADSSILQATKYKVVDTEDDNSMQEAVDWWLAMTEKGGEGMVFKPYDFVSYGKKGLIQPAVKCRGSEYLRIIYGLEYDSPENLKRLKKRGLSRKRSLALQEFALGMEALERFVRKEPLRKTHETVFGVLALESEEIDPRL